MTDRTDRRQFLRLIGLGSTAALLAACGQSAPAPSAPAAGSGAPAFQPAAPANQAPAAAKGPTGEVVWYSTAPQTMLDTAGKKFTETHPGMTLRGQYLRAPELVQKLDAEAAAGKPVASIVMVPNPVTLYQWRDEGKLLEHHSPEEKAYPDWFKEPGWWIATRVLDIPLVYNTKLISEEPKGWDAMADPKLKGKLAFNDPGTVGGPTLLHYKLLKERFGPDFWPKVVQNEPKILEQTGQVLDAVVNGEAAMGTMYGYDVLGALAQNSSAPLKPLWPPPTTVGFSANVIMKNSPNPDAARIAFDWLASKEGIQTQISVHPMLTARDDVDLGPNRVKLSKLDWKPFDVKAFAAEENALKAEWKGVFKRQ